MNRDKHNLILLLCLVVLGVLVILFSLGLRYINTLYIGFAMLLVQQFYAIPKLSKLYHSMHELEDKWTRYLPVINEIAIFPKLWSTLNGLIVSVLLVLSVIAILPFIGVNVVVNSIHLLFGDIVATDFSFYTIICVIIGYIISNIIRGLGFIEIKRSVNRFHLKNFGAMPAKIYDKLQYLALFIPFLRTIALLSLTDTLNKMMVLNNHIKNVEDFEEEEENEFFRA